MSTSMSWAVWKSSLEANYKKSCVSNGGDLLLHPLRTFKGRRHGRKSNSLFFILREETSRGMTTKEECIMFHCASNGTINQMRSNQHARAAMTQKDNAAIVALGATRQIRSTTGLFQAGQGVNKLRFTEIVTVALCVASQLTNSCSSSVLGQQQMELSSSRKSQFQLIQLMFVFRDSLALAWEEKSFFFNTWQLLIRLGDGLNWAKPCREGAELVVAQINAVVVSVNNMLHHDAEWGVVEFERSKQQWEHCCTSSEWSRVIVFCFTGGDKKRIGCLQKPSSWEPAWSSRDRFAKLMSQLPWGLLHLQRLRAANMLMQFAALRIRRTTTECAC